MWNDIIDLVEKKPEPMWKSIKYANVDIVDIKTAVKFGLIRFYIKDDVIYCRNRIGEVVRVGEVE